MEIRTEIISRRDAKAAGLKRYFTGKPCLAGHISERLVSSEQCMICSARSSATYQQKFSESRAEYKRSWYLENKVRLKTKLAEGVRKWSKENPAKVIAKVMKRRAARKGAVPIWFGELDDFAAHEAAALAKIRQSITGIKWHVDHMIPIQAKTASGLHCAANLQVIPAKLNREKCNRLVLTLPGEWVAAL